MLINYFRVFVGRPLENERWFAGSIKIPKDSTEAKDLSWRPATIRFKQGTDMIDTGNLPAIIRVDVQGATVSFEKEGKMRCFDISGIWEYEEIHVETYRKRGE